MLFVVLLDQWLLINRWKFVPFRRQ